MLKNKIGIIIDGYAVNKKVQYLEVLSKTMK